MIAAAPASLRRGALLAASLLLLGAALALPGNLADAGRLAAYRLPLEWPLLVLVLVTVPARLVPPLAVLSAALLSAILLVKTADTAMIAAYGRHFDFGIDLPLIAAGWDLVARSIGKFAAAAAFGGAVGALVLLAWLFFAAANRVGGSLGVAKRLAGLGAAGLLAFGAVTAATGETPPRTGFDNSRALAIHWAKALESRADMAALRREMRADPAAAIPAGQLLGGLAGKDVLLVFVESYGRAALERPPFADTVGKALADAERQIAQAGLSAASGWLTSTTVGGQSWLAHATALSGLRIDSQRRYNSLIASGRDTLIADFSYAGWRTVAVVPAIRTAWPEGRFFGYDAIYDARGLGYAGRPFNWVTMPDQFTLERFERIERGAADKPVFAEIALISSHAPWTPIPPLVDWERIGDGTIFNRWADSGDPPEVLWRDMDRVRIQYRRSLDYVLRTIAGYAARYGGDDLVMIVLGDHQTAPLITGDRTGRDVPMHVIAGDPAVVEAARRWGLTPGMRPAADLASIPMQDLRSLILTTFSTPLPGGAPDAVSAASPAPQSIR